MTDRIPIHYLKCLFCGILLWSLMGWRAQNSWAMENTIEPGDESVFREDRPDLGAPWSTYATLPTHDNSPDPHQYGELVEKITSHIGNYLRPEYAPCDEFVANHLILCHNRLMNKNIHLDIAYLPLRLRVVNVLVAETSWQRIVFTFAEEKKVQITKGNDNEVLNAALQTYFAMSLVSITANAEPNSNSYSLVVRSNLMDRQLQGVYARVAPGRIIFNFDVYALSEDLRPAHVPMSGSWFAEESDHEYVPHRFVKPFVSSSILDSLKAQIDPAVSSYVTLPVGQKRLNNQLYTGVAEAFVWRMKNALKSQFVPCSSFVKANMVLFPRQQLSGGSLSSDMAYLSVQLGTVNSRPFLVSESQNQVAFTVMMPWAEHFDDENDAKAFFYHFMSEWFINTPAQERLIAKKNGNQFQISVAEGQTNELVHSMRAIIAVPFIVVVFSIPTSPGASPLTNHDSLGNWFDEEK